MKMTGRWTAAASTRLRLLQDVKAGCKGAACSSESDLSSEGDGVRWGKARRFGVVELERIERGGSDGRSGEGSEVADATNPIRAAV